MNDFENKIKGVLKKEVEKPLSYDYAIKNAFYNSKNKRKSNLLLKLATTTSCLILIFPFLHLNFLLLDLL